MQGFRSKSTLLRMIPRLVAQTVLTMWIRKKYSVAEDNKVSLDVARKWTDELFVMLEEMVPGVTKA